MPGLSREELISESQVSTSSVPPCVYHRYHTSFRPPCNWRPTVCELASLPKLALPTVNAALVGLDRLKVGVFVRLKDSARNSSRRFSAKWKSLKTEKSRFR